jgi:hypothetical protein
MVSSLYIFTYYSTFISQILGQTIKTKQLLFQGVILTISYHLIYGLAVWSYCATMLRGPGKVLPDRFGDNDEDEVDEEEVMGLGISLSGTKSRWNSKSSERRDEDQEEPLLGVGDSIDFVRGKKERSISTSSSGSREQIVPWEFDQDHRHKHASWNVNSTSIFPPIGFKDKEAEVQEFIQKHSVSVKSDGKKRYCRKVGSTHFSHHQS